MTTRLDPITATVTATVTIALAVATLSCDRSPEPTPLPGADAYARLDVEALRAFAAALADEARTLFPATAPDASEEAVRTVADTAAALTEAVRTGEFDEDHLMARALDCTALAPTAATEEATPKQLVTAVLFRAVSVFVSDLETAREDARFGAATLRLAADDVGRGDEYHQRILAAFHRVAD